MSSPVRAWIAVGVVAFVGSAAVRPAIAQTAPAAAAPKVTPLPGNATPPTPTGYPAPTPQLTTVHRPWRGLVIGGAVMFGVSWGLAVMTTVLVNTGSSCSPAHCSADYLWIPIAGPLITAGHDSSAYPLAFLWSAAEAAGLAIFLIGLVGRDVMEYRIAERGPTLRLAPMFARDTSGMALTARW